MSSKERKKWIKFILVGRKPKTEIYDIVYNDEDKQVGGLILGQIKWFPRWRKYSFFPANDTVWEQDCLDDIVAFLYKLKTEKIARTLTLTMKL